MSTTATSPATAASAADARSRVRDEFIRRFLCSSIPDLPTLADSLRVSLDDVLDWASSEDVALRMERIARTTEARSRILTCQSLMQVIDAQTHIATSWHPQESATPSVVNRWMETARRAGGRVIDLYQFQTRRIEPPACNSSLPAPSTPPSPTRRRADAAPPAAPATCSSHHPTPSTTPASRSPLPNFSTTPPIAPTPFPAATSTHAAAALTRSPHPASPRNPLASSNAPFISAHSDFVHPALSTSPLPAALTDPPDTRGDPHPNLRAPPEF